MSETITRTNRRHVEHGAENAVLEAWAGDMPMGGWTNYNEAAFRAAVLDELRSVLSAEDYAASVETVTIRPTGWHTSIAKAVEAAIDSEKAKVRKEHRHYADYLEGLPVKEDLLQFCANAVGFSMNLERNGADLCGARVSFRRNLDMTILYGQSPDFDEDLATVRALWKGDRQAIQTVADIWDEDWTEAA